VAVLANKGHGNGLAALIFSLNIIEIIIKDAVKDYDSGFNDVLKKAKNQNLITYRK